MKSYILVYKDNIAVIHSSFVVYHFLLKHFDRLCPLIESSTNEVPNSYMTNNYFYPVEDQDKFAEEEIDSRRAFLFLDEEQPILNPLKDNLIYKRLHDKKIWEFLSKDLIKAFEKLHKPLENYSKELKENIYNQKLSRIESLKKHLSKDEYKKLSKKYK